MKGKHTFESSLEVNVPVEKLFGWHENVGAFERLTPSFDPVTVKKRLGEGIDGGEVHIKLPYVPLIWVAKLCVARKWPSKKERGMNFFFDVVDWVGGYPYEYASIKEFSRLCQYENLITVRVSAATVPTGCNESIFRRESS